MMFFENDCGLKPAMELNNGTTGWLVFALSMLLSLACHVVRREQDKGGNNMKTVGADENRCSRSIWFLMVAFCETAWAVGTSYAGSSLLT